MTVGCCALAACKEEPTNYRGLNFGKYYLENSDDVYIEIKADHKAFLHNLDFSDFDPEEYWGDTNEWTIFEHVTKEEVINGMQGEKEYWYFDDSKSLAFIIKSPFGLEFNYNGTSELEFEGIKYIKK